ncbi:hypothetical protein M436DRAFT_65449 [Aureobasidium namibiae CBS 147.97]|uniref:Uncharacterized protein n=1 Tax=Aureobasidium namibiae CBS 147.97 TaxID=1043004 RepID=A0A074X9K4_9PEZI|nr:uncharacterized protein M436DRAFT_65449 [Aureobasidium namibiae CBS 147.97]KEQ71306.1 hypothetical protein M436DRAFT_65449 [Aureobasidium namibiae CBS 147.97]
MSITRLEAIFGVAGQLIGSVFYWLTIAVIVYCFRRRIPVNDPAFIPCVAIFGLINFFHDLYLIVNYPWSILGVFLRLYLVRLIVDFHESRIAQASMVSMIAIAYSLRAHSEARNSGPAQNASRGTPTNFTFIESWALNTTSSRTARSMRRMLVLRSFGFSSPFRQGADGSQSYTRK